MSDTFYQKKKGKRSVKFSKSSNNSNIPKVQHIFKKYLHFDEIKPSGIFFFEINSNANIDPNDRQSSEYAIDSQLGTLY